MQKVAFQRKISGRERCYHSVIDSVCLSWHENALKALPSKWA